MKRIASLLLCLVMAASMMPVGAFAQEADSGCACTTKCTQENVNAACPVCGAAGADLGKCTGTEPEPEGPKTIKSWHWTAVEQLELIQEAQTGVWSLKVTGQTALEDVLTRLPQSISATLADGTETTLELTWESQTYVQDDSGSWPAGGSYAFTPKLPEGYALEVPSALAVTVTVTAPAEETKTVLSWTWAEEPGDGYFGQDETTKAWILNLPGAVTEDSQWAEVTAMLPGAISATLDSGSQENLPLTWACATHAGGSCPGNGNHLFQGSLPQGYTLGKDTLALEVTVQLADLTLDLNSTEAFTVTGGVAGTDYTYENNVLTIQSGTALTIANADPSTATTDRIEIASGVSANITLSGVNIDVSQTVYTCAFKIADNSTGNVTITLGEGTANTLKSGANCAGLQKNGTTGTLTIQGSGSLTAIGLGSAAGIGSGLQSTGSKITINSGTITAKGGYEGAGIGGCYKGSGSDITITGGTVNATGGQYAAGIGAGTNARTDNIFISGGSVKASAISATPVNNSIEKAPVYLLTISNPNDYEVTIGGKNYTPVNHKAADSSDGNLYVYLPAGNSSLNNPLEVKVGSDIAKYYYDTNRSKFIEVVDIPAPDKTTFTYDGTEKTYNIPEHNAYTVSGNKQTNVGPHKVTVSLKDKENTVWSDGTAEDQLYDFVISKADAEFTNLVVKNGDDVTSSFTYGDVITVIFTPQAAKTRTAPAQNQAALFLNGDPITDPVDVGDDGSFTLTYDTAGKKIPLGNQTLTVKYGGSSILSDGETGVSITLNAKAVTAALGGATTKTYDGTTNAPNGLTIALSGVESGDVVTAAYASAGYDSADVGTGKTITATGITLGGGHAAYYTLSNATAATTGTITQAQITGKMTISGRAAYGQTLTAVYSGSAQVTYQWLRNGVEIAGATGSTYTLELADVGQQIRAVVTAKGGNYQGSITSATVSVEKLPQEAPETAPKLSRRNRTTIVLRSVGSNPDTKAKAEYGISYDGGQTWHWQESRRFEGLTANTTYTFALRYQATDTYEASPRSETVKIATTNTAETNPWTGDQIAGAVLVMVLALTGLAVLTAWQIKKRKKK